MYDVCSVERPESLAIAMGDRKRPIEARGALGIAAALDALMPTADMPASVRGTRRCRSQAHEGGALRALLVTDVDGTQTLTCGHPLPLCCSGRVVAGSPKSFNLDAFRNFTGVSLRRRVGPVYVRRAR